MKNKFLMALLSLAIAFALWFYVITVVGPESSDTYYNIPVVYEGESILEERGLIVTDGMDRTVTMILSGNRSDLFKVDSSNITLKVDLSKIYEPGKHSLNYSHAFPGNIAGNAFIVESKTPDTIDLTVERLERKSIDVVVNFTGSVADEHIADKDNLVLDYTTVNIEGPEPVISGIDHARIDVDLTGRNASFSEDYRYTLCNAEGEPVDAAQVTTDVGSVNLTLSIQKMKEIELKVKVVAGGGATEQTSLITIEPKTIKIAGSDSALEKLEYLEIGTVDLGELDNTAFLPYPITLPNGVTNLTGVTEATVTVQFPELMAKEIVISTFNTLNVPEGMEAEIVTKKLMVTVRGPKELVSRMTAADITVNVDFSGETLGTFTKKPEIIISAKYADVGTMGSYSITASLSEIVEVISDDPTGPSTEGQS